EITVRDGARLPLSGVRLSVARLAPHQHVEIAGTSVDRGVGSLRGSLVGIYTRLPITRLQRGSDPALHVLVQRIGRIASPLVLLRRHVGGVMLGDDGRLLRRVAGHQLCHLLLLAPRCTVLRSRTVTIAERRGLTSLAGGGVTEGLCAATRADVV